MASKTIQPINVKRQPAFLLIGSFLLIAALSLADMPTPFYTEKLRDQAIEQLVPGEFAAFEQTFRSGGAAATARAAIRVVDAASRAWMARPASEADQKRISRGYCAAWQLALRVRQTANNKAARKLILNRWDAALQETESCVAQQIYALGGQYWDRSLLTTNFWRLLQDSTDHKTVGAMCYVLFAYGNASDRKPLEEKVRTPMPEDVRDLLNRTISHIRYKHGPKRTPQGWPDPGPNCPEPHPEF